MSGLTRGLELNQPSGWPAGIMSRARPLPAGWETGIEFRAGGCPAPVVAGQCATFNDTPTAATVAAFSAFTIRQSTICSTLSGDLGTTARDRLAQTTEFALGAELATGTATGNAALSDATDVAASASTVTDALSCLLAAAATTASGVPVTLHANMQAAAHLVGTDLLTGTASLVDRVIVSPGYPVTDGRLWITGPVWWAATAPQDLEAIDWRRNSQEEWAQREAIVVFDPCLNLTADFDIEACTPAP